MMLKNYWIKSIITEPKQQHQDYELEKKAKLRIPHKI